jgi:selenocysteine lyase/cysteine desulfurase
MSLRDDFAYFDKNRLNPSIYLNTASVGLPPRATVNALHAFSEQWSHEGGANWESWFQCDNRIRERVKALMERDQVSLVMSVAVAAGLVARHVLSTAKRGKRLLLFNGEFSSVSAPFADVAAKNEIHVEHFDDSVNMEQLIRTIKTQTCKLLLCLPHDVASS